MIHGLLVVNTQTKEGYFELFIGARKGFEKMLRSKHTLRSKVYCSRMVNLFKRYLK